LLILPVLYIWVENIKKKKGSIQITNLLVVLMCIPLSSSTFSQDAEITLNQAIDSALLNNKIVLSSQLKKEYQVQVRKSLTETPKTNILLTQGQFNSINKTDNNITISQTIPFPTVYKANGNLGSALVESANREVALTKNELVYEVRKTYLQLQFLNDQARFLDRQDSLLTLLSDAISKKVSAGDLPLLNLLNTESQLASINGRISENKLLKSNYEANLRYLTGSKNSVKIAEKSLETDVIIAFNQDISTLNQNPQIALLEQEIKVIEQERKVEIAKSLPDITVGYFNQTLIGTQNVNGQDVYFDAAKRFQGFQIGVAIPIVFTAYSSKIKASEINHELAEQNLLATQLSLENEYQQVLQELNFLLLRLDHFNTYSLTNASKIIEMSQKAYNHGDIGSSDHVINIQTAGEIQEQYLITLLNYNLCCAKLNFLQGKTN
jgi:heavy metal efflux system protein